MNVFYEEDGGFKVAVVHTDLDTSLHVVAAHGKRSKIKASSVLLRFERPELGAFMAAAQQVADAIELDFLWQCCESGEFSFESLGKDYFGSVPTAVQSAGLLMKLHGAPMYFYKKGKGRYRAAPEEALKAALAGAEKKRLLAEQKQSYVDALLAGRTPPEFAVLLPRLLYAPDKNSVEFKALEAAGAALKLTPQRVLARSGALRSALDYHIGRFLFEHFPQGSEHDDGGTLALAPQLPQAEVQAFSIDDTTTTEIDDAFSVTALADGGMRVGIHIAVPALGIAPGSELDAQARRRLSTVYIPGQKFTMLPPLAIDAYTLAEGSARPALSLYAEIAADASIIATYSRCELVPIAANLSHDDLDSTFNLAPLGAPELAHAYAKELGYLWQFALRLEQARGVTEPEGERRAEYNFYVEDDRVRIVERQRGSPSDKLVAELMIYANTEWGRLLAEAGRPAIYRAQTGGLARMTIAPERHEGLGAAQYAWSSSPLRRYVDLANQRQLLAILDERHALEATDADDLLALARQFEVTYAAYIQFQRDMERYWCLRWIEQEHVSVLEATVIRDNLVRFDRIPLVLRVPTLRNTTPGLAVTIAVGRVDLWELSLYGEVAAAPTPHATLDA